MTLGQYDAALKMRNIIRRLALQVVNVERPSDKVGRVVDVDRGSGIAKVVYAGDETNALRVIMYPGIQPPRSDRVNGVGLGSIVRISGPVGARYISEILSDGPFVSGGKFYNPRVASGGDMESSLVSEFAFRVDAPAESSTIEVATLTVPNRAASVDIACELTGPSDSFVQTGRLQVDWTAAQNTTLTATTVASSSTGMNLTFTYTVNVDQLTINLTRGTGTRAFTTANVWMRCVGTDISVTALPESGA
jgi:hypothetical protein